MTLTAWKRAVRALSAKGSAILQNGSEIHKRAARYGIEYSLYSADGNCVTVEWNLDNIKDLVVD